MPDGSEAAVEWIAVVMAISASAAEIDQGGEVDGTLGKGVTLRVPDDSLSMTLRARIQVRASDLVPGDPASDPVSEIVVRRARLSLSGHALTHDLVYSVQLAFSNQDTEPDLRLPLRDAFFTYGPLRDLQVRAGQYKVPFGRQRVTSSGAQQLVDRSIVVAELNLDRDVGVTLLSTDLGGAEGRFGYAIGVFGGDGRNRLGANFGYLGAARVMIRPFGGFDDDVEADLDRAAQPRLAIGAGGAYNQNTNRPRSTTSTPYTAATFDYAHAAADAMFKWSGLCVQTEWMWRQADRPSVVTDGLVEYSRSGWGWHVQAGQMLTDHLELAARYADLHPARYADPELVRTREIGGGASYYFMRHQVKLQGDYFYLPTGDTLSDGGHQVRVQTQIAL